MPQNMNRVIKRLFSFVTKSCKIKSSFTSFNDEENKWEKNLTNNKSAYIYDALVRCALVKIPYLSESQYSLHILIWEKDQFCDHSWSLESFHTVRIFVWKFNFHHVFFPKTRWMAWWKLNFHTKILRVWKDSKLQEWFQNWSFSLINMWSEYWLS